MVKVIIDKEAAKRKTLSKELNLFFER